MRRMLAMAMAVSLVAGVLSVGHHSYVVQAPHSEL